MEKNLQICDSSENNFAVFYSNFAHMTLFLCRFHIHTVQLCKPCAGLKSHIKPVTAYGIMQASDVNNINVKPRDTCIDINRNAANFVVDFKIHFQVIYIFRYFPIGHIEHHRGCQICKNVGFNMSFNMSFKFDLSHNLIFWLVFYMFSDFAYWKSPTALSLLHFSRIISKSGKDIFYLKDQRD